FSVKVVEAPAHVLPPAATTAPATVPEKAAASAEPPSLLMTTLLMIKRAGWSLFVTVHVFVSPSAIVPLHSAEDRESDPWGALSPTLSLPTLVSVNAVAAPPHAAAPADTATPLTVPEKSAAAAAPPSSLTTTLLMTRWAAWSSFVTVHVLVSPSAIVPLHSAENVASYPGCAFSATL